MTAPALMRVLLRRWYVVVAVFAVLGATFLILDEAGGAYVSETKVLFVVPGAAAVGVFDDRQRDTLVEFVGAIEQEINEGTQPDRLSPDASLFGAGVTEGHQVVIPNTGGQWQYSFPDPVLSVRVVGHSPEQVGESINALLDRIDVLAADRQSAVDPPDVISTERVPAEATVSYVGGSRRTQARALLVLGLVGLGVAAAAAVLIDRLAGRVSNHRRPRRPAGPALPTTTSPGAITQQTESVT
jgi:hypothetical protein